MSGSIHTRGRQLNRFTVGDIVASVEVLKLLNAGESAREQRYRVRYLCCGEVTTMTHRGLVQSRIRGSVRCKTCSNREKAENASIASKTLRRSVFKPFANGAEIGNAVVLASANRDNNTRDRMYRVRNLCCGEEAVMSHAALRERAQKHRVNCYDCRGLPPVAKGDWRAVAARIDPVLRLALSGAWV